MNTTKTHVNASISSGRIIVPYNEALLDCYWPFVRVMLNANFIQFIL